MSSIKTLVVKAVTSRKFWMTVFGAALAITQGDYQAAYTLIGAYVGFQALQNAVVTRKAISTDVK